MCIKIVKEWDLLIACAVLIFGGNRRNICTSALLPAFASEERRDQQLVVGILC